MSEFSDSRDSKVKQNIEGDREETVVVFRQENGAKTIVYFARNIMYTRQQSIHSALNIHSVLNLELLINFL